MKKQRKIPKSSGPHSPKLAALESEIMEQHLQGKPITGIQKWLQDALTVLISISPVAPDKEQHLPKKKGAVLKED